MEIQILVRIKNPTIFNIIRWEDQSSCRLIVYNVYFDRLGKKSSGSVNLTLGISNFSL
jgi:hypothetical protein